MGSQVKIPVIKPSLDSHEIEEVTKVINSGWVTQGPKVLEFEEMFAKFVGSKYAVAVSSCTTALHLSLLVNGVKSNDEVILPSHTFIATANAVTYCGATPVFVDIDPKTFNMDSDKVESAITPKTKAIIIVHQMGLPADIDRIIMIVKKYNLKVIEDAACAIGSEYKRRLVGSHSDTVCFSFHPRKVITTGDGGMISTNSEDIAVKLRLLRQHGMSVNDLARHNSKQVIVEEYPIIGYNYRLTDLQAAIGIEQLKKLPEIIRKRRELAGNYNNAFSDGGFLIPPFIPEYANPNYQSYCVYFNQEGNIKRDNLMRCLLEKGIATRRGIMSVHREKPYRNISKHLDLKNSEYASDNAIILPLYPQMTMAEQEFVIDNIKRAFRV